MSVYVCVCVYVFMYGHVYYVRNNYMLPSRCKFLEIFIQELFCSSGGIQAIVPFLRIDIKKFSCGLGHHRLLLAAVDCIWYGDFITVIAI